MGPHSLWKGQRGVGSWHSCHGPELGKLVTGWGRGSFAGLGSGPPTVIIVGTSRGLNKQKERISGGGTSQGAGMGLLL